MENNSAKNKVVITGIIEEEFQYAFRFDEKNFYRSRIRVMRTSGVNDFVPFIIPEDLVPNVSAKEKCVEVRGNIHSRDYFEDGKHHLDVYVYPYKVKIVDNTFELSVSMNTNKVLLNASVIKSNNRKTPFGRNITDLLVRVMRGENCKRLDIIPCIAWGRTAERVKDIKAGEFLQIEGRFQSRTYTKMRNNGERELHETYEISVMNAEI